jgi:hypothetical protein
MNQPTAHPSPRANPLSRTRVRCRLRSPATHQLRVIKSLAELNESDSLKILQTLQILLASDP